MSNDRSADQELLAAHRQRLRALEIQAARYGLAAPAHITNEIDDLKATIAELERKLASGLLVGRFREWVVDQMHRGDFLTIGEAIEAVNPGDRILIRPGVYHEALVLNKPLELIGEGEPGDVLVQASEDNVIHFDCARGLVKNLTLRQTSSGKYVVEIVSGRLDLEDCDISGGFFGVIIAYSAHPRLRHNRIHDNQSAGVVIAYNGQGLLEDNEFFGHHARPAVGIMSGANPVLRRNRIYDNQGAGVIITENGQGLLEENEIFGHADSAVLITTGANPILCRNRIHDNQSFGVYIFDNGQGLLEENEIFGHALAAVAISTGANPILRRNHIHDNKSNGIWIHDGGGGSFEHNVLFNNKGSNWDIALDCWLRVRRVGNSK